MKESSSKDLPPVVFEEETSAESFFNANAVKQARGTFQEVDVIRWDHAETDWNLGELDFDPRAMSASQRASTPPSEDQCAEKSNESQGARDDKRAFERLQGFALQRRRLGAAAALEKASRKSTALSKREWAEIESILESAETSVRYRADSRILRSLLFAAEMPECELERQYDATKFVQREAKGTESECDHDNGNRSVLTNTRRPKWKEISSAALQIREIAADRNWLSPKSSRALTSVSEKSARLSRSERNALNYLLDKCGQVSELTDEIETLRRAIEK